MTKLIKTQWRRALIAALGLIFVAIITACTGPYEVGPCTCKCTCTSGPQGLCRDQVDQPGTEGCEKGCRKQGTNFVICNDATTTSLPPPQGPNPVCPSGQIFAQYAFCETCTDSLSMAQIDASSCTESDAETQADAFAVRLDGSNCSVELCKGDAPGFIIHIN